MGTSEDRLLVEKILTGEPQDFQLVIEKYRRLVGHIVARMVRNQADREDVGQEIFVKIYQSLASFQFQSKLSTWISRIAFNACVNYLQKKRLPLWADLQPLEEQNPIDSIAADGPNPEQRFEAQELTEQVHRAIAALAPVYAAVLSLYHLEEFSYQEISEVMELPQGTVKSYLFRARKKVKEQVAAFRLAEVI